MSTNVLGGSLQACSYDPLTGYLRDGCCSHEAGDRGAHLLCVRVTAEFLDFSLASGNDLLTPLPEFRFTGLKPGDRWCLCVLRWIEALEAGCAPPVVLEATHARTLDLVPLATLRQHAWPSRTAPH